VVELRKRLEAEGRTIIELTNDERSEFASAADEVIANSLSTVDPKLRALLG
jgi:hypothetical protein